MRPPLAPVRMFESPDKQRFREAQRVGAWPAARLEHEPRGVGDERASPRIAQANLDREEDHRPVTLGIAPSAGVPQRYRKLLLCDMPAVMMTRPPIPVTSYHDWPFEPALNHQRSLPFWVADGLALTVRIYRASGRAVAYRPHASESPAVSRLQALPQ
jgi:hypothetical protein